MAQKIIAPLPVAFDFAMLAAPGMWMRPTGPGP